jgi:hypothetical protein
MLGENHMASQIRQTYWISHSLKKMLEGWRRDVVASD